MGAIKTRREGLSRRFGGKIDGHEDRISVMIVSVPYGLVLIGIKPRTYFDHRCGKFSIAYPDRDTVHSPPHVFVDATMASPQISGQGLLTKIIVVPLATPLYLGCVLKEVSTSRAVSDTAPKGQAVVSVKWGRRRRASLYGVAHLDG